MLGEGTEADPAQIDEAAERFSEHLYDVGDILRKLKSNGWETTVALYDIYCHKDISDEEAEEELKDLGIELGEGVELEPDEAHEIPDEYKDAGDEDDDGDEEVLEVDFVDPWSQDDLGVDP